MSGPVYRDARDLAAMLSPFPSLACSVLDPASLTWTLTSATARQLRGRREMPLPAERPSLRISPMLPLRSMPP
jgi:hypothetical protein